MKQKILILLQQIKNKLRAWPKTTAFGLGLLLTAALPPYHQFWAVFASFSGALYLCYHTERRLSLAALGYWFGFAYFAFGLSWIGNALLVDADKTGWLYPICLFAGGAFFGLFTIFPFVMTSFNKNIYGKILLFAGGWLLVTEWLRGFILTGFPWNPISSTLAFRPAFLQTAAIWGTYGLSMVLIIIASLPAVYLLKPTGKNLLSIVASFILTVVLWGYGDYILLYKIENISEAQSIMIRLVQPSIAQSMKWDKEELEKNLTQYIEMSTMRDNHYIDFIVWGETASPFDLTYDNFHKRKLLRAVPKYGYLVSGFLRYENDGDRLIPYNSFAVMDRKGHIVDFYDKNHLVPFGEYIPFRQHLPSKIQPLANTVSEFGRGEKYKTIRIADHPEFAPLICYEIIFSGEVVRRQNKPKWMILLTNDGWYGLSSGPYQHLVAAQMRAVEEGISIVRSANSGISAVITPYGQILGRIGLAEKGISDVALKPDLAHPTLFGRYGNTIPLTMGLLMILIGLLPRLRRLQN